MGLMILIFGYQDKDISYMEEVGVNPTLVRNCDSFTNLF